MGIWENLFGSKKEKPKSQSEEIREKNKQVIPEIKQSDIERVRRNLGILPKVVEKKPVIPIQSLPASQSKWQSADVLAKTNEEPSLSAKNAVKDASRGKGIQRRNNSNKPNPRFKNRLFRP